MTHGADLLDILKEQETGPWRGRVWRHMFAGYPPDRENTQGARWNPARVAAIYTSLERSTALAEAEYHLSLQPVRPRVRRTMYLLEAALHRVMRLGHNELTELGITPELLGGLDLAPCQSVGGAVAALGHDGLFVPSARGTGSNLVIFPANRSPDHLFKIVKHEVIEHGPAH